MCPVCTASPKESHQRKGDPQSATPSLCEGANLRRGGCGVRRGTRFALRAPLRHPRRVRARSTRAPTRVPPRNRLAAGAASRGWDSRTSQQPHGPLLRSAQAAQRVALAPAIRGRAQRWPVWMFCTPVPLWMRRGAQGLADQGSRVSERRAAARVERDPAKPEHRRLPRIEAQGTQTAGSPFLWFLYFGDAKERDSHAGRLPASALNPGTETDSSTSSNNLRQVLLNAEEVLSNM